jgi:hypothetical protein
MADIVFDLSPTQYAFAMCPAHIVQLMGPMGEGKTVAGVAGCIAHAERCGTDIRGALVRDTFQNIKTSTIPDMRDYLGDFVRFSDGDKKATIMSQPKVELDMFGIDDAASISKLQGPQYAIIWLEEPAPIVEKINAGLPKDVFNLAVARAARQRRTVLRVQITQNPGEDEHWTSELEDEPEEYADYTDSETGERFVILKKSFRIRPGENKYLPGLTRAANRAAFKDDPGKWARYVEGKKASVIQGVAVAPAYSEAIHHTDKVLPVYPRQTLISMWDSYQHPACILAQYTPSGQLVIHDAFYVDGLGPEDLFDEVVEPVLLSPKYAGKIIEARVIGDPSMATPDQSSVHRVSSRIIEAKFARYGRPRFERGPVRWPARKDAVNQCWKRLLNDGQPAVMVSGAAVALHRAMKGGWHYKKDNNGKVVGDMPVKNQHDHPGMAFSYGISLLMPYSASKQFAKVSATVREMNRRRALGYSGNNFSRSAPGGMR